MSKEFFKLCVLPELLGKWFTRNRGSLRDIGEVEAEEDNGTSLPPSPYVAIHIIIHSIGFSACISLNKLMIIIIIIYYYRSNYFEAVDSYFLSKKLNTVLFGVATE